MRILAVDDDPVILDLLQDALLRHEDYDLVCASSAEEALAVLESSVRGFDCFLLDIMLPGVDGIELCDAVRQTKEYRSAPIIMITASREPDLMTRAFYAGATDFVTKPLNGVELGARINAAGMLNDSLLRERQAYHSLAELTEKTKIRFEEPIALDVPGVTDLLSMENDLLRLPAGIYPMHLFWIDVMGLPGIHKAVTGRAFRHHLDQVAKATGAALKGKPWKLSYAGCGRFAAVVMDRKRPNREDLLTQINAKLTATWDGHATEVPMPPALRVTPLSEQRLWTGRSASDFFRQNLNNRDVFAQMEPQPEERLFDRFDTEAG